MAAIDLQLHMELDEILKALQEAGWVRPVRCWECRYAREPRRYNKFENVACDGVLICCVGFDHVYPSSDDGLIFVDGNGYCSQGERKDGDGDAET